MRAILTWHSVDASGSPISVSSDTFRRQVDWLGSGALRVVSVDEVLGLDDDANAAALTFDDGFSNFATEAAPRLHEWRLPATLFVVTGHVGRDNRWQGRTQRGVPVMPLLDWEALGRLAESGVSLGAHTRTHPNLMAIGPDELEDEIAGSAAEMERRLGQRPAGLAYPYGAVDSRIAAVTARCFRWAVTTDFRAVARPDLPTMLPRFDAWYFKDADILANWGRPGFRVWAWSRRQGRRARAGVCRLIRS